MYTSVAMVALTGFLAGAPAKSSPSWLDDYDVALLRGKREGKPLAVFIASGPEGYKKVCRNRTMTQGMKELLAKEYVCVYVNTNRRTGKKWARAFGLDKGIVISDR